MARMRSNNGNGALIGGIAVFALFATVIAGWVINIFKLVALAQATDPNYIMAGLRTVGIFVPPLGAILGLFV